MANDGAAIRPNWKIPKTLSEVLTDPGTDGPQLVRAPVWPPMLVQSTSREVFDVYRSYSCSLGTADTDNVTGVSTERKINFTVPVIGYALSASVRISDGSGFPVGWSPLDTFDFKLSTQGGEAITVDRRMGGNVLGTAQRPGFLGGAGWVWNVGTVAIVELVPQLALPAGVTLGIDITMHCIEFRRGASYLEGGR